METTITVNGWLRKVFYVGMMLCALMTGWIAYRQQAMMNRWERLIIVIGDGEWTPTEMDYVMYNVLKEEPK